jgi:hypothetical protein
MRRALAASLLARPLVAAHCSELERVERRARAAPSDITPDLAARALRRVGTFDAKRGPMTLDAAPHPLAIPHGRAPRAPAAGLASPDGPPPALPAEHFAAALAFFGAGALGLVLVAPELAAGAFYAPRVVAVVHLFTLGWLVLSIFGALCQFLPVAVGRPLRWQRAAHASFVAQAAGAAAFVAALAVGNGVLLHAGACGLAIAFALFAANLAATLAPVEERTVTWWALAAAAVFLVVTPAYGVVLAYALTGGGVLVDRFAVVATHAHVAIVGVVLLTVVGVAHRLLPMFLLSHGASERPGRVAVALLAACAALLALPVGGAARVVVAGALGSGGVVAFVVQAAAFFRHRKRRALDPGLRLAAAGVFGLVLALALAPFALGRGLADLHLLVAYVVVLLGALTLFVAGHYFKIVPFLVWYHRFGPLVGARKVPKVADLYSARAADAVGLLLVSGWLGLAIAAGLGAPHLARAAAVVFTAGAWLEGIVIARVARRRAA